ncbi:hypothetical protein D3C84_1034790 [compost metagenome]
MRVKRVVAADIDNERAPRRANTRRHVVFDRRITQPQLARITDRRAVQVHVIKIIVGNLAKELKRRFPVTP